MRKISPYFWPLAVILAVFVGTGIYRATHPGKTAPSHRYYYGVREMNGGYVCLCGWDVKAKIGDTIDVGNKDFYHPVVVVKIFAGCAGKIASDWLDSVGSVHITANNGITTGLVPMFSLRDTAPGIYINDPTLAVPKHRKKSKPLHEPYTLLGDGMPAPIYIGDRPVQIILDTAGTLDVPDTLLFIRHGHQAKIWYDKDLGPMVFIRDQTFAGANDESDFFRVWQQVSDSMRRARHPSDSYYELRPAHPFPDSNEYFGPTVEGTILSDTTWFRDSTHHIYYYDLKLKVNPFMVPAGRNKTGATTNYP